MIQRGWSVVLVETQEQLAEAAKLAVATMQTGVDQVKKGASSLTSDDVEAQV